MKPQQLKDLAKQAGFITFAGPDIHVPEDPYGDGYAAVLAKFAELIIRECARVDSEANNPDHEDGVTYNYTILEHFGIEE